MDSFIYSILFFKEEVQKRTSFSNHYIDVVAITFRSVHSDVVFCINVVSWLYLSIGLQLASAHIYIYMFLALRRFDYCVTLFVDYSLKLNFPK